MEKLTTKANDMYQTKFNKKWHGIQACLSTYTKSTDKGVFKCLNCGNTRVTSFGSALNRFSCRQCSSRRLRERNQLTNNQFLELLHSKQGHLFAPKEKYQGRTVAIKVECTNCHSILTMSPRELYRRSVGCPNCSQNRSSGELYVQRILDFNKVNYVKEYAIYNPLTSSTQRIDYYLPDIRQAIEIQGSQHRDKKNARYSLKRAKADKDKYNYLISKGIKVLYIDEESDIYRGLVNGLEDFKNLKMPSIDYIKTPHVSFDEIINYLKEGNTLEGTCKHFRIGKKLVNRYIKLAGYNNYFDLYHKTTMEKLGLTNEDIIEWLRYHKFNDLETIGVTKKYVINHIFKNDKYPYNNRTDIIYDNIRSHTFRDYRKNHTRRETERHFMTTYKTIEKVLGRADW